MELGEVVVSATGIEKYFGSNHVLRGVSLDVRQHETVMLIGRSGSGKTTMLRCLNFLEEPTVGTVRIGDISVEADPLHTRSRPIASRSASCGSRPGMVFQDFNLFPHMTVLQNCIEAPTRVKGVPRDAGHRDRRAYLDKVQLHRQARRVPVTPVGRPEAAGGDRPGADAWSPVLMFDEPTSALDPELVGEVLRSWRSSPTRARR